MQSHLAKPFGAGRAGPHGTTEEDSGVEVSESAQFDRISGKLLEAPGRRFDCCGIIAALLAEIDLLAKKVTRCTRRLCFVRSCRDVEGQICIFKRRLVSHPDGHDVLLIQE